MVVFVLQITCELNLAKQTSLLFNVMFVVRWCSLSNFLFKVCGATFGIYETTPLI